MMYQGMAIITREAGLCASGLSLNCSRARIGDAAMRHFSYSCMHDLQGELEITIEAGPGKAAQRGVHLYDHVEQVPDPHAGAYHDPCIPLLGYSICSMTCVAFRASWRSRQRHDYTTT